jgi:hypothetical protein
VGKQYPAGACPLPSLVDCLQQVKTLGEKDERQQKEQEDLRGAAQKLMDMVDPPEGGKASPRPLLERLREASQKVVKFLSEARWRVSATPLPS